MQLFQPLITRRRFTKSALQTIGAVSVVLSLPATLSACSSPTSASADELIVTQAVSDKHVMISRVVQALSHPDLSAQEARILRTIEKNHSDHLAALLAIAHVQTQETSSSNSPELSFADVVADSTKAAQSRIVQIQALNDPQLIRLFCLIGASESVHAHMVAANV